MRIWIVILVLVVAAAGAWFFLRSPDSTSLPVAPEEHPVKAPPGEPGTLTAPPPEKRPPLEALPVPKDVRVLLLANRPGRLNLFFAEQWDSDRKMKVLSWSVPAQPAAGGEVAPPTVLPNALPAKPRVSTLSDESIDVVVIDDLDPSVVEDEFWADLAKKVEQGEVGLLAHPGIEHGADMLAHPVLGPLLPVASAKPIRGQPVPGTFLGRARFVVTNAGERHLESRLVQWPTWSKRIWDETATLETPWGTPFCYPVESVRDGATVLLQAEPLHGDTWPCLIEGNPDKGRVLWFGAADLGEAAAYGRPRVVSQWQLLVRNWIAWLATSK